MSLLFQVVNQENTETTASVSIQEFAQVCKDVDHEIEEEFAGVFAQKRTYLKATAYVDALLDPCIPMKSAWDAAEWAGYETPGPFQSLIGENKWREKEVWDRITCRWLGMVRVRLEGDPLGLGIVFDETADEKRGKETAGVGYQYAGSAGGVVNCVTWVMASLLGPGEKTWVAADLFLPEKDWFTGRQETGTARRKRAGIPRWTRFASKPQLALKQLRHVRELGAGISFGCGDEVYGRYAALREDHEKNGEAYAYFVPRNHVVKTLGKERRRVDELLELSEARFEVRSAGPGINGPRYYEWAMIGVESENHFLLLRKPVREEGAGLDGTGRGQRQAEPGKGGERGRGDDARDVVKEGGITFCLCYVPPGSPVKPTLGNLALMAGRRWRAEETMATGKGPVGWDESQFRRWNSMQHHTALAGLAMLKANMIGMRLDEVAEGRGEIRLAGEADFGAGHGISSPVAPEPEFAGDDLRIPLGDSKIPCHPGQDVPGDIGFIRLSVREILRLKAIVFSGLSEAEKAFHLRWSKWRRRHQAIARWYHRMDRIKAPQEKHAGPVSGATATQGDRHPGWHPDARAALTSP